VATTQKKKLKMSLKDENKKYLKKEYIAIQEALKLLKLSA
jgi:hypothetical protein